MKLKDWKERKQLWSMKEGHPLGFSVVIGKCGQILRSALDASITINLMLPSLPLC